MLKGINNKIHKSRNNLSSRLQEGRACSYGPPATCKKQEEKQEKTHSIHSK